MKKLILIMLLCLGNLCASAQLNQVNRIPKRGGGDADQAQYTDYERGFWFAAEALGAYSCNTEGRNTGMAEVDLTVGYRFSQYFRVGVGSGPRYYFNPGPLRDKDLKWAMPLFATVRGNLMSATYRKVVPYYGIEVGTAFPDGFMVRPTIGMRIGAPRQAFTLGVSYMGQELPVRYAVYGKDHRFTSFVCLRLGFEF